MSKRPLTIQGTVVKGHQVASGQAINCPYPSGTIAMQSFYFKALGLDLTPYFPGTINLDISPNQFDCTDPTFRFDKVKWAPDVPAENFSFFACRLQVHQLSYSGFVYYPHPETKVQHFQTQSVIELLMPWVEGLKYGHVVKVFIN